MAKEFEDKFFDELREGVIDNRTELEKRRDELKQAIKALEENVIKDPKAIENLKKELAKVDKEINKEEAQKAVETGEVVGKGAAEQDKDEKAKAAEEKEEEIKDEKNLSAEEKEKQEKDEAEKLQAYHDKMVALHEARMASIKRQKDKGALVISEEDFNRELELEAEMYQARDAYMDLGKDDPYRELRTEYIKQEKEARDKNEMLLRNMSKRFYEIEQEIRKLDKREQEINEELLKDDITDSQIKALTKEQEEIGVQRQKLETERADIREKLNSAINIRRERDLRRVGLEQKHVKTLTTEDEKNYRYQQGKVATMYKNFDDATKQHYDNIRHRIETREQKIKDINKELKETPDTDLKKRLKLLDELDKETNMLVADREAKSDLDRGIIPDAIEEKRDIKERKDEEEYRQEEMDKATETTREVAERQDEQIGEAVVDNPAVANVEEQERESTLNAAAFAMVYDSPEPAGVPQKEDGIIEDASQFGLAKMIQKDVKQIDDTEEGRRNAQEYLEQDKQIREADKELEKVQENIEQKIQ